MLAYITKLNHYFQTATAQGFRIENEDFHPGFSGLFQALACICYNTRVYAYSCSTIKITFRTVILTEPGCRICELGIAHHNITNPLQGDFVVRLKIENSPE